MTTSAALPDSNDSGPQLHARLKPEALGAFIDAVYAVAITMLALEIPSEINTEFNAAYFANVLVEYCIAFVVLFAFWFQHRRINSQTNHVSRSTLWVNAVVLLLVCLVPRATTFVFEYGDDVTLVDLELRLLAAGQSRSVLVDGLYVLVVLVADLFLLLLSHTAHVKQRDAASGHLRRVKATTSALLAGCLLLSLTLPISNRYFVMSLPVMLLLEEQLITRITRFLSNQNS